MRIDAPGMESVNDYPGPKGFMEQLDRGLPIAHKPEKIRKALAQLDEHEKTWTKVTLDYQERLTKAQQEIQEINRARKKLRRLL